MDVESYNRLKNITRKLGIILVLIIVPVLSWCFLAGYYYCKYRLKKQSKNTGVIKVE